MHWITAATQIRPEFIEAFEKMANEGLNLHKEIKNKNPYSLINLTKAEIILAGTK